MKVHISVGITFVLQRMVELDLPCHGDVFQPEKLLHELCTFLARRVPAYTWARQKIQHRYEQIERACQRQTLGHSLARARREEQRAVTVAAEVQILTEWMEQDVLAVAGPPLAEREELYDLILTELERYQGDRSRTIVKHRQQNPSTIICRNSPAEPNTALDLDRWICA
jgi:hypothetical protein